MRTSATVGLGSADLNRSLNTPPVRTEASLASATDAPLTIEQAREHARAAMAELSAAIRSLKSETRSVFHVVAAPSAPVSRDDRDVPSSIPRLSAVATGAFGVRGVAVPVDASKDTQQTQATETGVSSAGVTASFDGGSDPLSSASAVADASLARETQTGEFPTTESAAAAEQSIADANTAAVIRAANTSGLLAALGMAVGAMHTRAPTAIRTQAGTETVTNANDVSLRAAAAIDKLNAALAAVAQLRTTSPEASRQVEAAIRAALALIAAAGVEGITIGAGPGRLRIDFDTAKVSTSLVRNALALGAGEERRAP